MVSSAVRDHARIGFWLLNDGLMRSRVTEHLCALYDARRSRLRFWNGLVDTIPSSRVKSLADVNEHSTWLNETGERDQRKKGRNTSSGNERQPPGKYS